MEGSNPNYERYLEAYWTWVHPTYPIIDQTNIENTSPLFWASILALGAHMLKIPADMKYAGTIHERCIKDLEKLDIENLQSWDVMAIFLIELYSIFKSRRPPLQLSEMFKKIYRNLAKDEFLANTVIQPVEALHKCSANLKPRLLSFYYILDQQHATLFGRERTDCMGSLLGLHLLWPASRIYTNSQSDQQMSTPQVYGVKGHVPCLPQTSRDPAVSFQWELVMACLIDPKNDGQTVAGVAKFSADISPILSAIEQTTRFTLQTARFTFHTFMLCKYMPVRDLLAVVGESWVMSEKLSSQKDYTAAQINVKNWAEREMEQPEAQSALYHALQILDISDQSQKTGLMFEEWAVYLAAVVVWARGYTIGTKTIGWDKTRNVLLKANEKISQVDMLHNCGLTNGALDVLKRLLTRGNEPGWLGDSRVRPKL